MSEVTRYATFKELSQESVRVLRVTTRSGSQYTVGLVGLPPKRMAVLLGRSKEGGLLEVRDPEARLDDGRSLFSADPETWVGASLEVGSISTSRIIRVENEEDAAEVTSVRSALAVRESELRASGPEPLLVRETPTAQRSPETLSGRGRIKERKAAPKEEEAPAPLPYPADHVHELQIAAACLRRAYQKRGQVADLEKSPELLEPFRVALAECALLVQALGRRMTD